MMRCLMRTLLSSLVLGLAACAGTSAPPPKPASALELGAFSISLTVKDLAASRAFYEKLGFHETGGDAKTWLVLRNGDHVIGLFQGLFPKNMLTFNPGWNQRAQPLPTFTDVRAVQQALEANGITLTQKTDPAGTGPAHLMLVDPDGNPILIDQHVPKAK